MIEVIERTFRRGGQRWRIDSLGGWAVLMFGTFGPSDGGYLRYQWVPIEIDRVPTELVRAAKENI